MLLRVQNADGAIECVNIAAPAVAEVYGPNDDDYAWYIMDPSGRKFIFDEDGYQTGWEIKVGTKDMPQDELERRGEIANHEIQRHRWFPSNQGGKF